MKSLIKVFLFFLTSIVLVEAGLHSASIVAQLYQWGRSDIAEIKDYDIRILALGESTTHMGGETAWPMQLESLLKKEIPNLKIKVINKGLVGTNTSFVKNKISEYLNTFQPHYTVLMLGINDSVQSLKVAPHKRLKIFEFYQNYRLLNDPVFREQRQHKNEIENLLERTEKSSLRPVLVSFFEKMEFQDFLAAEEVFLQNREEFEKIDDDEMTFYLGSLYFELGKMTEMRTYFDELLESKSPVVQRSVDFLYRKVELSLNREIDYALDYFLRARKTFGEETPYVHNYLTLILVYLNNSSGKKTRPYFDKFHALYKSLSKEFKKRYEVDMTEYLAQIKDLEKRNLKKELANNNPFLTSRKTVLFSKKQSIENYNQILYTIRSYGSKAVVVQYPLRPMEETKKIIEDISDIIFVENYSNFKEALKSFRYAELFIDRFAGDFGHATPKGNEVIALSVADRLKQAFNRSGSL